MEYRQLGKSGLRVSKLCLGTMVGFTEKNYDEAKRVDGWIQALKWVLEMEK